MKKALLSVLLVFALLVVCLGVSRVDSVRLVTAPLDYTRSTGAVSLSYSTNDFYLYGGKTLTNKESAITTDNILDGTIALTDMAGSSVDSSKIFDNTILIADINSLVLKVDTVEITKAQLLALSTTPVQLVAAPGSHYIIEVIRCILIVDYNSTPFTADVNTISVRYNNGSGAAATGTVTITALLGASADNMAILLPAAITDTAANLENKAIVVAAAANPVVGNSVMHVKIIYRKIPTGL